ncbi:hypothetical protein SLEP1_g42195 [Rubroshorea leprosula]|uniref:Uncharacterized protein n=1 Tax=Rubroshorea leprosula TaxID=152421 RepID=A0AAV5L9Y8_9ROSI|nr:hypothetical protein SLEP1_g42195 [Rubroshorea leprosula]
MEGGTTVRTSTGRVLKIRSTITRHRVPDILRWLDPTAGIKAAPPITLEESAECRLLQNFCPFC